VPGGHWGRGVHTQGMHGTHQLGCIHLQLTAPGAGITLPITVDGPSMVPQVIPDEVDIGPGPQGGVGRVIDASDIIAVSSDTVSDIVMATE